MPPSPIPTPTAGAAPRLIALTVTALLAFAANSVLCRLALRTSMMSPVDFTAVRIVTGAGVLWLILILRGPGQPVRSGHNNGGWAGALALSAYAVGFSLAYVSLTTGTGALLLFGAVQLTMICWGLTHGERMDRVQAGGLALALAGMVWLLLPGLATPSPSGAALMIGAGIAWGVYSLLGRRVSDPLVATRNHFVRAIPMVLAVAVLGSSHFHRDGAGVVYAALSGGLASGLGYAVWYTALRGLSATQAATVQLSVPVIAALGGVLWLAEPITVRLAITATLILGGIALVVRRRGVGG